MSVIIRKASFSCLGIPKLGLRRKKVDFTGGLHYSRKDRAPATKWAMKFQGRTPLYWFRIICHGYKVEPHPSCSSREVDPLNKSLRVAVAKVSKVVIITRLCCKGHKCAVMGMV